jgi:hypothetical protein
MKDSARKTIVIGGVKLQRSLSYELLAGRPPQVDLYIGLSLCLVKSGTSAKAFAEAPKPKQRDLLFFYLE